jgi:hypothetical protein
MSVAVHSDEDREQSNRSLKRLHQEIEAVVFKVPEPVSKRQEVAIDAKSLLENSPLANNSSNTITTTEVVSIGTNGNEDTQAYAVPMLVALTD